jgi:hypothetical protein
VQAIIAGRSLCSAVAQPPAESKYARINRNLRIPNNRIDSTNAPPCGQLHQRTALKIITQQLCQHAKSKKALPCISFAFGSSPHVGQLGKLSRSWNFSADATAPTSFHDLAPLHVAARIDQQAKLSPCEIPSRDVRLEVDQKMTIDHRGRP